MSDQRRQLQLEAELVNLQAERDWLNQQLDRRDAALDAIAAAVTVGRRTTGTPPESFPAARR